MSFSANSKQSVERHIGGWEWFWFFALVIAGNTAIFGFILPYLFGSN